MPRQSKSTGPSRTSKSPRQPFQRPQAALLLGRLKEPPQFIQILAGPRQVGKTTLVRQVAEQLGDRVLYAAADLPTAPTPQWIEQQWARAMAQARATPQHQPFVLILDEVQKIPR
jgi:uncharacterized protein